MTNTFAMLEKSFFILYTYDLNSNIFFLFYNERIMAMEQSLCNFYMVSNINSQHALIQSRLHEQISNRL